MSDPRPYTEDEIREKFLAYARATARYWSGEDGSNVPAEYTALQRTSGAIFSLLAMLDGSAVDLPGFKVMPDPHPDDERYHKAEGENWFPDDVDIAGCLHELLRECEESRPSEPDPDQAAVLKRWSGLH